MAATRSAEHVALGVAIREARRGRGFTLEDLAHRIVGAVSVRYLAGVERGEANVSFAGLLRICDALDIDLLQLISAYTEQLSVGRERSHAGEPPLPWR